MTDCFLPLGMQTTQIQEISMERLFCTLGSQGIVNIIEAASEFICYAGPGVQKEPATAMIAARQRGLKVVVSLDVHEHVLRMGYGDVAAVEQLREAGIEVAHTPGLRTSLILADHVGYVFTPTALYLEPEPSGDAPNAMRLSPLQIRDVLTRLSPATKLLALAQAPTSEERSRIAAAPLDLQGAPVAQQQFDAVKQELKEAPPVPFNLARQVRVFEPYLQYVEMSLSGAAVQRSRLAIPPRIQKLGGSKDLEGRLRTTFDLIDKQSKLSSKALEKELNDIRKDFTPSVGKEQRVVLKRAKAHFEERLAKFRQKLDRHRETVEKELQQQLDKSKKQVVDYYLPRVRKNPPDSLLGRTSSGTPSDKDARWWLQSELDIFPSAKDLIDNMELTVRFKDVTFETLNQPEFLENVKEAFPNVDWDKAYRDFKAVGETATPSSPTEKQTDLFH